WRTRVGRRPHARYGAKKAQSSGSHRIPPRSLLRTRETVLASQQHQHFINYVGAQMRCHVVHIVWWADGGDVDGDDVEIRQASDEVEALPRRQTAPRWRADPGRTGGVEHVHVEADVDWAALGLVSELGHALVKATAHQLVERDDAIAELSRTHHHTVGERGTADTHVPGAGGVEQSFLGHVRELGRGVVLVGWVVGIRIGVRVDVECDE